jgi:septum site-determining protein MinC
MCRAGFIVDSLEEACFCAHYARMAASNEKAFELEGMVAALSVLRLISPDLEAITRELDQKITQSPVLFKGAPVVIDLTELVGADESNPATKAGARATLRLAPLVTVLKAKGLVPVAVRATHAGYREEAVTVGLGLFDSERAAPRRSTRKPAGPSGGNAEPAAEPVAETRALGAASQSALVLTQPLRAGQIVYAEARDVVALAAVNPGGELIADGNVHVYAPLRGRALAGAKGDEQARIFCQRLEADLVSVAGVYLSADELPQDKIGKPVQISLRNGELVVADLITR